MKTLVIHNGLFRPGEVLAIALLKCFIDSGFSIVRTRDLKVIGGADVGGDYSPDDGQFDHHQEAYKGPLASVRMEAEWISQGGHHIPDELKKLINIVDKNDTGETRSSDTFIETIKSLNYSDLYSPLQEIMFETAVAYAVSVVQGLLVVAPAITENEVAKAELEEAIEEAIEVASSGIDKGTIIFSKDDPFVPMGKLIGLADISVQWDKGQSCWTVEMVPLAGCGFMTKHTLSYSKREDEIFCHRGGFIGKYRATNGMVHPRVNGLNRSIPVED